MENQKHEHKPKPPFGTNIAVIAALMFAQHSNPGLPANPFSEFSGNQPGSYGPYQENYMRFQTEFNAGSALDRKIYSLAESAQTSALPAYSPEWYQGLFKDGVVTQAEEEALYTTYYQPSPDVFVGTSTRFGPLASMMPDIPYFGKVIRDQMARGYVLTASGNYGYHHELERVLPEWVHRSVYGRSYNPRDLLLDGQNSTVYVYLAERNLDHHNQPVPVAYAALNENQKLMYDLTSDNSDSLRKQFVPVEEQQEMGPERSLESGTFVSTVAGISPNDIGRRFLLFHKDKSGKPEFYGVVLVTESINRDDWTGGADPMMLRSQSDPATGEYERWAFDFPDELYYAMGGNGGPVYGVIAVDAQVVEHKPVRRIHDPE